HSAASLHLIVLGFFAFVTPPARRCYHFATEFFRPVPEFAARVNIQRYGKVIEVLQGDGAGSHFAYCFWLVGNEIYYNARHRCIERTISDRQFLRVTDLKSCTLIGDLVACKRDKAI